VNNDQTVEFLQQLIQHRSDSGDHSAQRELQATIAGRLRAQVPGAAVLQSPPTDYPWTFINTGPGNGPMLLFACHVDTVPVGDPSHWAHPPFSGHISGDRIHGRGTTDMKGGIAAAASAFALAGELNKNVGLLLTADEEIGSLGAADAATGLAGVEVGAVIIPEATANRIVLGHRGALWLRIRSAGLAAHGSTPGRGINAALKLSAAMLRAGRELPLRQDNFLGSETWNLGTMKAGSAPNIVPDSAEAVIDMRVVGNGEELHKWWKDQPEVSDVETVLALAPLRSSVPPALSFAGMEIDKAPAPYFTDGSRLTQLLPGVPVVIWGPGAPEQMHALNEFLDLQSLSTAVKLFQETIIRWP
jgi:succinyl-diaminopimelate desuccinylase